MMTIRFWGVRGSLPTGERRTAQIGGNTACVEVYCDDSPPAPLGEQPASSSSRGVRFVLDGGSGLRALGAELMARGGPVTTHILLSHFHWDHIQGIPFFTPSYIPGNEIHYYGACQGMSVQQALASQMTAPFFPVTMDVMGASLNFHDLKYHDDLTIGPARVRTAPARHPNGCLMYRIDCQGVSMVYATDTEHPADGSLDQNVIQLARDADILVYDSQYTPEEYLGTIGGGSKRGWGHSTAEEGIRLAQAANVAQLILFHHDPLHDDAAVGRIEAEARARMPSCCAAREGMQISLPSRLKSEAA